MKTRVLVELTARKEVEIVVEHEPDEDPTDLTKEDEQLAKEKAEHDYSDGWVVNSVDELGPADE